MLLDSKGVREFVPLVPTLDAELEPIMMHKAQKWGLPVDWVAERTRLDPRRRQVCTANDDCASLLQASVYPFRYLVVL